MRFQPPSFVCVRVCMCAHNIALAHLITDGEDA